MATVLFFGMIDASAIDAMTIWSKKIAIGMQIKIETLGTSRLLDFCS